MSAIIEPKAERRRLRGIFLTAPAMGLALWAASAILLWLAVRGLG